MPKSAARWRTTAMPAELSGILPLPEAVAPWIRPLGLALLHALWQGLAIGALAALALRTLRHASPQARYATACTALAACVLWPALTLWRLAASAATTATTASPDTTGLAQEPLRIDVIATTGALDAVLPWLVALWACGAALMLLRTAVGLHWVAHLRRRAQRIAEGEWAQRMQALSRRFGLGDVPLAVFEGDGGPLVAGLWRPMVFVPASLLAKMPPELLEALLAHELAHIRRHDYLANLLQRAAEALLFFHPVVWWLSRRVRQERELVADDLAASVLGEPKRLALALAELDQTLSLPNLAQAAHGGQLMSRIRSLLHPRRPSTTGALPLGVLAVACIGCLAYAQSSRTPAVAPVAAATAATASAGTASADKRASRSPRIATDGTIALVDADRDGIRMSGHSDDVGAIRDAKREVGGDFLWLRRDGKAMVVRDPATVARVRELWNDRGDAETRMEALQAEMERHAGKLEAISQRMQAATPDGGETPAMREAAMKTSALADQQDSLAREQAAIATRAATRAEDGAQTAGEEARIAEIDRRMAAIDREMANTERALATELAQLERSLEPLKAMELEMQAASKPMEELSRKMQALAVEHERQMLETDRRVRAEFDRAIAAGLAEPVKQ
jgi:beta-lactamase regulating signal transducer with metallopeptidase domain